MGWLEVESSLGENRAMSKIREGTAAYRFHELVMSNYEVLLFGILSVNLYTAAAEESWGRL
jgi:hypothetical protein